MRAMDRRAIIVLLLLVMAVVWFEMPLASSPSSPSPSPSPSSENDAVAALAPPTRKRGNILADDSRATVDSTFKVDKEQLFDPRTSKCKDRGCGCAIAKVFGLQFAIADQEQRQEQHDGSIIFSVTVVQEAGNTSDLSWSARAVSDDAMVGAPARSVGDRRWRFDFWLPSSTTSPYRIEITLTWINDLFIGTKWKLPNRDDNPPNAEKKRKCLALELVGDCARFGLTIFEATARVMSGSAAALPSGKPRVRVCRTVSEISANGAWFRVSDNELAEMSREKRDLLDDFVGLNRFRGGVWQWSPRGCRIKWYSREEALAGLAQRGIRQITLFGDSMLLEQFGSLRKILEPSAATRSSKQNKLRSVAFSTSSTATTTPVTVTFLRSYTTSGGHSVIASPHVVSNQVAATNADVVVGNAAVLHWQQNMRKLDDWRGNVRTIAKRLCHSKSNKKKLFYWGPTLIQMGRTQGLQPHRTLDFGFSGRDAFSNECGVSTLWFYNASIARRESAHDGQHWACYREWGGVAATFSQMFLNVLLN